MRGPHLPARRAHTRALAAAGGTAALLGLMAAGGTAASAAAGAPRRAGTAAAARAYGRNKPAGFWYGTDSFHVNVTGKAPYTMPVVGGAYGGYIGMTGSWAAWQGCHTRIGWSSANSRQANTDYTTYHRGIGTGVYWFMGGPGVDPRYNGTKAEAYAWGQRQAARTLYDISHIHLKYPVVFMDIELPGNAPAITPAADNGWNSVYTSPCSGRVRSTGIPAAVDRAEFNGFFDEIAGHSRYTPGVYSSRSVWRDIFGSGPASRIRHTHEWTYNPATSSLARPPAGWCLKGTSTCAAFYGGVSRGDSEAVMWQWSGGGGTYNGYGDFDQIDANRTP